MAAPLIVRLVMDAAGYLKTVDTAVASNTRLERSSLGVGEAMQVSANKSVAASLKATEALKAQIATYRQLAVSATESAAVRERANLLADRAQARLNSSLGITTAASLGASRAVQTGERDLGKFTRGALAGSGAASELGRSLAFASTGFIAIAGTSTLIASSIKASIDLAKTQRQVEAQLKTSGKSWDQYGERINQADLKLSHISGFTNQELLQGFGFLVRVNNNVGESLKLTALAADVARGRNISLASAAIALAKAQGGSLTALRRLGIIVPQNVKGLDALAFVQRKFAGQAAAGATIGDKFHAVLVDTEETIGTALLPTFTRLTTEITDWLAKMNETGRLQRDVNKLVSVGGTIFHTLGGIIHDVDVITGGFGRTLKLIFEFFLGREILKALIGVDKLAASWLGVASAANTAAAAEERATLAGAGAGVVGAEAGAAGGLVGGLAGRRAARQAERSAALRSRVTQFTGTMVPAEEVAAVGTAAAISTSRVAALRGALSGLGALAIAPIAIPIVLNIEDRIRRPVSRGLDSLFGRGQASSVLRDLLVPHSAKDFLGISLFNDVFRFQSEATKLRLAQQAAAQAQIAKNLQRGQFAPALPGVLGYAVRNQGRPPTRFAAGLTPIAIYSKYTQTISEQLDVARAALTKTTKDDVVAAKRIIARIKRLIDHGHLQGAVLVQALQDEASQEGVLASARQKAAQQAAQIAAAKKAAASSYSTPIDLQIAEVRAQLTASSADDIRVERRILAAARAALNSGKKNKQGQLAALQVILQAQQAIQSLTSESDSAFTLPLKLQLALAKAQALGTDQTKILLKMKAALERALKGAKGNIQKQIDIYNQIAAINQQLGSSAASAFGTFKQASTRALVRGLGLSHEQEKALRERLSRLGPGGTTPGEGVGAGGFIIDPDTGRPIQAHRHRRPHHGRDIGRNGDGQPQKIEATFNIRVYLDGKDVTKSVTIRQQRAKVRNRSQRRGPHAGGVIG